MDRMIYPMKLRAPLKDYLWGGTRLKTEYAKETSLAKVAESWELACHKEDQSIIENGADAGLTLEAYIAREGAHVALGSHGSRYPYFPLLIKLIDAHDDLSVQVHPDDSYAFEHEGEYGKMEMWYILQAEPGAEIIYGFKNEISREECRRRIEENTLLDVVQRVKVQAGDVIVIPAGTVHAIGRGILLAEVQQNSDTTYRVYDYARRGTDGRPRDLHIDKALDVLSFAPPPCAVSRGEKLAIFAEYEMTIAARTELFSVYHFALQGRCHLQAGRASFQSLVVLEGTLELSWAGGEEIMEKGDSYFIPAAFGDYMLRGEGAFLLTEI